jgi:hypothetical protein
MSRRSPYSPSNGALWSTLIVLIGWPAVWLLWPVATHLGDQDPGPDPTRFYLMARSEDAQWLDSIILVPTENGLDDATDTEPTPVIRQPVRVDASKCLPAPFNAGKTNGSTWASRPVVDVPSPPDRYEPIPVDVSVFDLSGSSKPNEVLIVLSHGLVEGGFEIPADARAFPKGAERWQVRARVETDIHGNVTGVAVAMPCDDPAVNAAVVRALFRGQMSVTGVERGGIATISWVGTKSGNGTPAGNGKNQDGETNR